MHLFLKQKIEDFSYFHRQVMITNFTHLFPLHSGLHCLILTILIKFCIYAELQLTDQCLQMDFNSKSK